MQQKPGNGERGHSLLCGREALAKPPGAAVYLLTRLYPEFMKLRREILTRRNFQGVGRSLTRGLWRAGGTPETHLVPPFCRRNSGTVMTKHFLSAVKPFYLNAAGSAAASAYSGMPQDLNPHLVHPSGFRTDSAQTVPAAQRPHLPAPENKPAARQACGRRSAAATCCTGQILQI